MILSGQNLEIDCREVEFGFPDEFIFVDWSCHADQQFDDCLNRNFYTFTDFEISAFYYDDQNNEKTLILSNEQTAWAMPDVEKAALNEFES